MGLSSEVRASAFVLTVRETVSTNWAAEWMDPVASLDGHWSQSKWIL